MEKLTENESDPTVSIEEGTTTANLIAGNKTGKSRSSGNDKYVGLAHAVMSAPSNSSLKEYETLVKRKIARKWRLMRFVQSSVSNILVFIFYLITVETIISVGSTIGLTIYWYNRYADSTDFTGGTLPFIFLGFAVITPITAIIRLAFKRREQALFEIRRIRTSCFQIYHSQGIWDWHGHGGPGSSGRAEAEINWLHHTDEVLDQLIGIGDELCRFLTLPSSSQSYHRTLSCGRKEAADIVAVSYNIFDSLFTERMIQLSVLNEKSKGFGLAGGEASRIRQYELFIGESMQALRMIKMYRTPQVLRAFGRIFSLIIPPLYAPRFAQIAFDLNYLSLGICFATITTFALTALFESTQMLEDPFVGYVSLDGIDVEEELQVLHWHQLINARKILYPNADDFDETTRVSTDTCRSNQKKPLLTQGKPTVFAQGRPNLAAIRSSRYVLSEKGTDLGLRGHLGFKGASRRFIAS